MAKVDGGGGHLSLTTGGGTQTLLGLDEAPHTPRTWPGLSGQEN